MKMRGKQRKAAKNLAAANRIMTIPNFVNLVRRGDNDVTETLSNLPNNQQPIQVNVNIISGDDVTSQYNFDLSEVLNNVLPVVLDFLQRCEHATFEEVMTNFRGDCSVGGGSDHPFYVD